MVFLIRVYRIHQRWASLHARLQNELLINLAGQTAETVTVTRTTEVTTEVKRVETSQAFRHVQECLEWIQNKQVISKSGQYKKNA